MARGRNRPSSDKQVEEQAMELDSEDGTPLRFSDALSWRAGKPIAVAELLRRLKALFDELESIEQEDAHRPSLIPKAQELANPLLLGHKDNGVKAYALLCVVEMFRLLAPDAPYSGPQLKSIFTLFISTTVPALASPSEPYNAQHHGVLTSLHSFKSITLLTDIPGSDNLILLLFSNCFDVLAGNIRSANEEQVGKNVEFHMTGLLTSLVDELSVLPAGVVDCILAQFLRSDPSAGNRANKKGLDDGAEVVQELSPAYNMARSVCNTCADKMVRHVGNYFSSVLMDASQGLSAPKPTKSRGKKRTHDESEDESEAPTLLQLSEEDLENIDKAHRLLRELWRSSSDVVRNVIPQLETELGMENVNLRILAVQAIGDMVAGIGAAGLPDTTPLDPAAYPSHSVDGAVPKPLPGNILLIPDAPHAFASMYPSTYQTFFDRCRDKSALVRSAWVIAAGRIVATSGGGKGLESDQESALLRRISDMLIDQDDKVRLAAVQAVKDFDFAFILSNLGPNGGVNTPGSVLSHLAGRVKDPKHPVRLAAVQLLGQIWGVASGAIIEGRERVRQLLGPIPSRILEAMYINDRHLNALIQQVIFDSLLPIGFPSLKSKAATALATQPSADSQNGGEKSPDPDEIRVQRLLCMLRDLEDKGKAVFFSLQKQQSNKANYLERIIESCQLVHDDNEDGTRDEAQTKLDAYLSTLSKQFPEPSTALSHLTTFFNHFDRRNHSLIRFTYSTESDYKKVTNAIKELAKRIGQSSAFNDDVAATILLLIRSAARLVYNRSHVPAVMHISRTDENGLGSAAHDILKEISITAPDVFKVHIKELCESLKSQAPSASSPNDPLAIDSLKACAGFAQRDPKEIVRDRTFFQAMTSYALYGVPSRSAKHAVTVIVAAADKKEMYVTDLMRQCVGKFTYGDKHFLSRLAAISQLRLLDYQEGGDHEDTISEIFTSILGRAQTSSGDSELAAAEGMDVDLRARLWALKIAVNGLRGYRLRNPVNEVTPALLEVAEPVFKLLNTLIEQEGVLSADVDMPADHAPQLRLAAAKHILKLCCDRSLDKLFLPADLNRLSRIAQDTLPEVRVGFNAVLKKYLGQGKLPFRFYSLVFIYAFEPQKDTKEQTITWLKARALMWAQRGELVMEGIFARFLSMLAHHADFSRDPADLEDFVDYILFYLKIAATEANLSSIYGIAQRIKTVQDGIDVNMSENLYVLSDLAEAIIRQYADSQNWSLQILPGKVRLPQGLFRQMPSHALGQEISEKQFLPEELSEKLEELVRDRMRSRKRKSNADSSRAVKKSKLSVKGASSDPKSSRTSRRGTNRPVKTPKTKTAAAAHGSSERRRSGRASNARNYAENEDSDDDEELEQWQADASDEDDKENQQSSTPPSSEPVALPESDTIELTLHTKSPVAKSSNRVLPQPRASTRTRRGGAVKPRQALADPSHRDRIGLNHEDDNDDSGLSSALSDV